MKILQIIRKTFPEIKLVTPNITAQLKKRKYLFSDFMTTEWKIFKDKDGKEFKRAVTYCHDLEGFIEYISILEDDYRSNL